MYSYGVDGDETLLHQQSYIQSQQQNGLLSGIGINPQQGYSNVGVQFDNTSPNMNNNVDEPSPRGEDHTPLVSTFSGRLLRTGLTLKAIAVILMCLFYLGFGGRWIFTFHSHPELSSGFHLTMTVLMFIYILGSLSLALFQAFVADDSKWTKGFRTGSKILSGAVTLDLLAASLRLVQYLYLYNYLSVAWWTKYNVTKSEWILFSVHNFIDGLSLILYGFAFFYMEAYHDEGTFEELSWIMISLYSLSGLFMIVMVFSGFGAMFMLLCFLSSIVISTYWSFLFEALLEKWSPELHSRDINTDILPGGALKTESDVGGDDEGGIRASPSIMALQENVQPQMSMGGYSTMGGLLASHDSMTMPGNIGLDPSQAAAAGVSSDIPTSYDYSQLQQQVAHGIEMGVVGGH